MRVISNIFLISLLAISVGCGGDDDDKGSDMGMGAGGMGAGGMGAGGMGAGGMGAGGMGAGGMGAGGMGECTPTLLPPDEPRMDAPMGCEEGCAALATCAIDEGICPNMKECDREGAAGACMAVCSEQLLGVFQGLMGDCTQIVGLATQSLPEFAAACGN